MELQRHGQLQSDNETSSSKPQLKTTKDLERHVSEIYTHSNFYKFQCEFWTACMDCEVDEKKVIQEGQVTNIVDNSQIGVWKAKLCIMRLLMWHVAHVRSLNVKVSHVTTYCVF